MAQDAVETGYRLSAQSLPSFESLAQSIGNIAPTATPALVIPLVRGSIKATELPIEHGAARVA